MLNPRGLNINNWINKGKTFDKETKEEKKKDESLNKRPHPRVQKIERGALKGENLKPKTQTHQ
jgi:hypothetical protein